MQKPTTRQSLGSLVEELKIKVSKSEGSKTPQEILEGQLTWGHGDLKSLSHQPGSRQELDLEPLPICTKYLEFMWFP